MKLNHHTLYLAYSNGAAVACAAGHGLAETGASQHIQIRRDNQRSSPPRRVAHWHVVPGSRRLECAWSLEPDEPQSRVGCNIANAGCRSSLAAEALSHERNRPLEGSDVLARACHQSGQQESAA